jgi:membrane associated rhomboid family serine protease
MVLAVWIFIWQLSLGVSGYERAYFALGAVPALLAGHGVLPEAIALIGPPWTLFSSLYLHPTGWQLATNLGFLWLFGRPVEAALTPLKFAVLYVTCGAFAALAYSVQLPTSTVPLIGANGAISGVVGAYLLLHPRGSLSITLPVWVSANGHPVPGWALALIWLLAQATLSAYTSSTTAVLDWQPHLTALLTGCVLLLFLKRRDAMLFQ